MQCEEKKEHRMITKLHTISTFIYSHPSID